MPHRPVDERQEHRLDRQIAPRLVERRRPQQHAAGAHAALEHRRRAGVEPRQHLRVRRRRRRCGSRRPGPTRSRRCAARGTARTPDGRTRARRRARRRRACGPPGCRSTPAAASTSLRPARRAAPAATNSPPPCSTNRASRAPSAAGTGDVVEHDDRAALQVGVGAAPPAARGDVSNSRRVANRQRPRQVETGAAPPRSTTVTRTRLGRRDHEVEGVVRRPARRRDSVTVPRMLRLLTVTGSNVTDVEPPPGSSGTGLLTGWMPLDLQRERACRSPACPRGWSRPPSRPRAPGSRTSSAPATRR